jgi:hypothetical protein
MTTTDLAVIDSPITNTLAVAEKAWPMIERICKASTLSPAYRGKPEEALAAVLMGAPLGLDLMQCLQEIHVIQGTPALSAKAQRGIVQMHGHKMWLVESSATKVVMAGHRAGDPDHVQTVTWTIDRAKQMGLTGKENWRKQPETMLVARASGELSRLLASDALLGLAYNVDEVDDGIVDEEWGDMATVAPPDAAPPPARTTKRSAKARSQRKATQAPHRHPGPTADRVELPLPPLPGEEEAPAAADLAPDRDVEHRRSDAIRIRTEEVLGELDRDDRLAFWSASAQREIGSGLDLTGADADLITIDLDLIAAGEQAWLGGKIVETTDAELDDEPDSAEDPPTDTGGEEAGWAAEDWKAFRAERGMSHAEFIKLAQTISAGVSSVPAVVELDPLVKAQLRAAVEAS